MRNSGNNTGKRRIWRTTPVLALAALSLLAACAPSTSTPTSTSQRNAPMTAASKVANACAPTTSASARLGPSDPARTLTISLVLMGDSAGLDAALAALNDPTSPQYHHFLSPQEYARRFGAASTTVASLAATLRAAGLRVPMATASAGLLNAQGTVATLDALFGVRLGDYCDKHGERYIAPDGATRISPASLAGVSGVLGLDTRSVIHTGSLVAPRRPMVTGGNGFGPTELERAYDLGPLIGGADGRESDGRAARDRPVSSVRCAVVRSDVWAAHRRDHRHASGGRGVVHQPGAGAGYRGDPRHRARREYRCLRERFRPGQRRPDVQQDRLR